MSNTSRFSYVLDKISAAEIVEAPFPHVEIDGLFGDEDFNEIVKAQEISVSADSDNQLFDELFSKGYKTIGFPGCTTDYNEYIDWHKGKEVTHKSNSACVGYGVALRLVSPKTDIIEDLKDFINSEEFISCIAGRFGVDADGLVYDAGLQKYLDGYEISPHTDIRRKALTYLVNINPSDTAHENQHHTVFCKFTPEKEFIHAFWKGNPKVERCWVPWEWCEGVGEMRGNNTMVIFAPGDDTMHAVKASYDHLPYQRTQLYGNLWYDQNSVEFDSTWEDFVIAEKPAAPETLMGKVVRKTKDLLPSSQKAKAARLKRESERRHY